MIGMTLDTSTLSGHRQRLRTRFLAAPDALPDYELLELLLCMAQPRGDTKELAKTLLTEFGSLTEIFAATPQELVRVSGLGETSLAAIKTVHEATARLLRYKASERPLLSNWQSVLDYCRMRMAGIHTEQLRLLFLNTKNMLIADEVAQTGTVDETPVYPREVVRRAIELHASALVMVHNHPSGDPMPSQADIDITRRVKSALEALDMRLHDHLVIGGGKYMSLKAMGVI